MLIENIPSIFVPVIVLRQALKYGGLYDTYLPVSEIGRIRGL
jgi:hypothetical protein